jgi:nitronate monooxygenase
VRYDRIVSEGADRKEGPWPLEGKEDAILPFPLQNALTRPMRTAAARRGAAEFLSLWAGRGVARARAIPAGDLVARLVNEALLG